MTSVTIPNSVTSIGTRAFLSCLDLTSITIPNSVTSIGADAFYDCGSLTGIVLESTNPPTLANANAFAYTNNAPIYVPTASLNTYRTASQWSNLADRIQGNTFTINNLTYTITDVVNKTVSVKAANTSISGAVEIPSSVSTGGITYSVTSIPNGAFTDCTGLTSITIPSSVTSIGIIFYFTSGLTSITVDASNPNYDSRDNCNAIIETANNKLIAGCKNTTIPNSVTKIGRFAFETSNLTSITIPNSVTSIGYAAFERCSSLTSITLESTNPPTLDNSAFSIISTSATFYLPNTSYLSAGYWSNILRNYKVVIPNKLVLSTGKWNFVAGVDNQASLYNSNSPASFVSGFTANTSLNDVTNPQNPHCDIAIMGYDNYTNNWSDNYLYASETMTKGQGYFVWPFNENARGTSITSDSTLVTVPYTPVTDESVSGSLFGLGAPNTSGSASACHWYALGNPFPQSLSVERLTSAGGSGLSDCIFYTYNRNNKNWITTADSILPGEGFMVGNNGPFGYLEYNITNPSYYQNNGLPAQPKNYGIRFTINANGINSDMFAKQVSEASDGFDTKDAYALFGNNENLVEPYFVVDGRQIIHNRYNSDNYACEINFHAQKSGVAELSVSDVPEGTTVSIVDLTMNTETVLESEPYQIDVEAGENAGRYQIKINKSSVSLPQTIENKTNISIWNNNREIFVKGENLQRVEVYNTLGQKVYQREVSGEAYNFTFDNEGAYIIKAAAGCSNGQSHVNNCTKTQKIVIR